MAGRIRTVKPEWLEDELLQESSSDARVLSIALVLLADDHGNGRGGEKFLAGQVFPGQQIKSLRDALARLVEIRYCRIYQVDGQSYFSIRNWAKHQRVDKPGPGKVPEPPGNVRDSLANLPGELASVVEVVAPRARPLPSLPDPIPDPEGSAEGNQPAEPEDRETVCPLDLVERADKGGLIDQCAKGYGVSPDVIRHHVAETLAYWTLGGGAGKRRKNWLRTVRQRLQELRKAGLLVMPVEAATDPAETRARREAEERVISDRLRRQRDAEARELGVEPLSPEATQAAISALMAGGSR